MKRGSGFVVFGFESKAGLKESDLKEVDRKGNWKTLEEAMIA
jgi:hypothetical protein